MTKEKIMEISVWKDGTILVCDWENNIFDEFVMKRPKEDVYDLLDNWGIYKWEKIDKEGFE